MNLAALRLLHLQHYQMVCVKAITGADPQVSTSTHVVTSLARLVMAWNMTGRALETTVEVLEQTQEVVQQKAPRLHAEDVRGQLPLTNQRVPAWVAGARL